MKPKLKKTLKLACVAIALTTFSACAEKMVFTDNPDVNPDDKDFTEVPLDFDWNMSQDIAIQLKSDVTTRAYIYEDENLQKLMCTTVLEADKPETITITALNLLDKLYLAYVDNNGKTAVRTIDIEQNKILTRSANISGDISDAAETLPALEGNKTMIFSPNSTVYGTVLFEDMYPEMGDYDMNDFVLGYRKQYGKNDTSETLEITLQIRAIGGNLPFVPGVEVKGVDVNGLDVSWTTSDSRLSVENASEFDATGTPVFRVNGAQDIKQNSNFFNVNQPKVANESLPYVTITLTRSIDDKAMLDIKDKDLNFFIYNTKSKVEIHEKNTAVTRFASNSNDKKFHKEGLVWAFRVEGYMPHTIEGNKIDKVFPKISSWMRSSGKKDADWLTDFNPNLVIDYSQGNETGDSETQKEPYINIKQSVVEAPAAGGRVEVPVEANCDFDVCFGEKGWIYDYNKEEGKLILYVYNNYNGTDKTATVTLTPTNDISKKFTFQISQKSEAYNGVRITANSNFRNNIENLVKANGGVIDDVKKVKIIGHSDKYNGYTPADLPANVWRIGGNEKNLPDNVYMEWDAATATITVSTPGLVVSTGNTCSGMFQKCPGLEEVDLSGLDISICTNMSSMFFNCPKLKHVDLTPLNMSQVTNISGLFTMCGSLETVNVKGLNTSNVNNMANVFDRCYSLKSADISTWNTDKVTNFSRMFWNCQKLEDVKLNCSKTSLTADGVKQMFVNCYLLQSVDMSSFDFHDATNFTSIFSNCKNLQTVVFGKDNTSKITTMTNAFENVGGNGEFTCVNADFSSVTNMDKAFSGCTATSINLSGWKTTSVQRLGNTFGGLANAKKINLSGWSADNATNIGRMFDGAKVVEEIDLGTNFNVSSSTDIDYWFFNTSEMSKKTTLKCSRATYDVIQKFINDTGGRNSKKFLTQYCTFSIY